MFITPYIFINFPEKIQPTGLFHPTRLFDTLESEFRSFFGRIEETINCFRDLLHKTQAIKI